MISIEDLLGFCPLSADEISVVAAHEKVPQVVALEKVATLLESDEGRSRIHDMFDRQWRLALTRGDHDRASIILRMMGIFDSAHLRGLDACGRSQRHSAARFCP